MRQKKEMLAFWLTIMGVPLVASSENIGVMIALLAGILALMYDNIVEALKR